MQKRILENLEPIRVFYHFENIAGIPHGSGNEEKLCDYCENFAKEQGLKFLRDSADNLIIFKDGTKGYENRPAVIIQGHLDMVCAKDDSLDIDMLTEPLKLKIYGEYIGAEGTSLGGDDGIAVAYALALLESDDIPHPPLEIILTTDEEVGMTGAGLLDTSSLSGKTLLNIDSEEEGVFTVGCAGGVRIHSNMKLERENKFGVTFKITVGGLLGGHSGIEIGCGRANSNIIMGELLSKIHSAVKFNLISLSGGTKDNVITPYTVAEIFTDSNDFDKICLVLEEYKKEFLSRFGEVEKGAFFEVEKVSCGKLSVVTAPVTENILGYLSEAPFGVQKMSEEIKGLVQTSCNLGVVLLGDDSLKVDFSVRSSLVSERDSLAESICDLARKYNAAPSLHSPYPAWEYKKDSRLRDIMVETYKNLTGKEPVVNVIHAGLECGLLSEKIKGLDAVSIGPNMNNIHSSSERLEIGSVMRTWEFIKAVLKNL